MLVPDSLEDSQRDYSDYALEPTQLSQPVYSQSQGVLNSQVEPRRKYWAVLIPTNPTHPILKLPWNKPRLQMGRGSHVDVGNDVILPEKRVSNRHCRISLGLQGQGSSSASQSALVQALKDGEAEPEVWVEDLRSSNGTFVNGRKVQSRLLLQHGDEISLGHVGTAEHHEVRYIYRSVGCKGARVEDEEPVVGEVYERYQMLATLGKGTFAEVKKAVDIETGDMRAIKQIVKHRFGHDKKTLNLFQREITICQSLTHENICRLLEWYEDPQHICLVLEYIDGGDLLDYIMNYPEPGLPEHEAADLAFQICRAVAYCHEKGITHRDLKPENILLTKESESQARIVKVADFGLAKMVTTGTMLVSMVGTPQYLAPEVVMQTRQRPGYENVVDSWSVGIIVYSMLTKALPFDDDENASMEQRIRNRFDTDFDREPLFQRNISEAAIDFISSLLAKDPSKRLSMQDALTHEWLAGPSSLPNESPSQVLGGDSMWNIQSFDSYTNWEPEEMDVDDADAATRSAWSRPMTMSATNFDSAASSGESFSQPMENLRLNTGPVGNLAPAKEETASPGVAPIHLEEDTATPGPESADGALPSITMEGSKTPAAEEVDAQGETATAIPSAQTNGHKEGSNVTAKAVTSAMDVDSSFRLKRKLSNEDDSDSDLSSPPDSQPLATPTASAAPVTNGRRDRDVTPRPTAAQAAAASTPRRMTRAATAARVNPESPASHTRSKADVRPRKSKRFS